MISRIWTGSLLSALVLSTGAVWAANHASTQTVTIQMTGPLPTIKVPVLNMYPDEVSGGYIYIARFTPALSQAHDGARGGYLATFRNGAKQITLHVSGKFTYGHKCNAFNGPDEIEHRGCSTGLENAPLLTDPEKNKMEYSIAPAEITQLINLGEGNWSTKFEWNSKDTVWNNRAGKLSYEYGIDAFNSVTLNIVVPNLAPRILIGTAPVTLKLHQYTPKNMCLFDGTAAGTLAQNFLLRLEDNNPAPRADSIFSLQRKGTDGSAEQDRLNYQISAATPTGNQAQRRGITLNYPYAGKATPFGGSDEGDITGLPANFKCVHWNLTLTPLAAGGQIPGDYSGQLKIVYGPTL